MKETGTQRYNTINKDDIEGLCYSLERTDVRNHSDSALKKAFIEDLCSVCEAPSNNFCETSRNHSNKRIRPEDNDSPFESSLPSLSNAKAIKLSRSDKEPPGSLLLPTSTHSSQDLPGTVPNDRNYHTRTLTSTSSPRLSQNAKTSTLSTIYENPSIPRASKLLSPFIFIRERSMKEEGDEVEVDKEAQVNREYTKTDERYKEKSLGNWNHRNQ